MWQEVDILGITSDSRRIKPGYVFVPLTGEHDSGYRYIDEAEQRGAVAIIANESVHSRIPVILYHEPRRKMAEVAKIIYDAPDKKLRSVGVGGTNGKTTVSHILRDILCESGERTALIGTNGYFVDYEFKRSITTASTTPAADELMRMLKNAVEEKAKTAVMEVSSHALELERVFGISFDVGIFTNLTQDHMDFHKSMESYFKAKRKLYESSEFCVINKDDKYGKRLYEEFKNKAVSVSLKEGGGDIYARDLNLCSRGVEFVICDGAREMPVRLNIPGEFSVYNALCAYAAAKRLGGCEEVIVKALENSSGVKGRAEAVKTDKDFNIIIDYAHTPDGLENIIRAVRGFTDNRVITLFGCGGNRDREKRFEMGRISGEKSDFTVITTDNPRFEEPIRIIRDIEKGVSSVTGSYAVVADRFEAIKYAMNIAGKGDTLLLAGKGHENYIICEDKKIYFDEREAIKRIIEEEAVKK